MGDIVKKSWKPVLRGDIYCAPACGGKCTKAAYDDATSKAEALAARLGVGWRPNVHENLGWHFSVISPCGRLKVSQYYIETPRYTALLGEKGSPGGRWSGCGNTPQEAIREAIAQAETELTYIKSLLEGLA